MTTEVVEGQNLTETLTAIQRQLAVLSERIATLEAAAGQSPADQAARVATTDATVSLPEDAQGPTAQVEAVKTAEAAEAAKVVEAAQPVEPAQPSAEPTAPAELSEETLLVLSAAIAAFLGKKPKIRQIRLVNSATWAHQGRASIHASHAFAVHSRSGAAS